MKPRKSVKFFVSFAHENRILAKKFINQFIEYTKPSIYYDYSIWRYTDDILLGENWNDEIAKALEQCDLGLLLISPSFLGSEYIMQIELGGLKSKPVIPVLLWPINYQRFDLKGLQKIQIFVLDKPRFAAPKSYGECNTVQRTDFMMKLFEKVEKRLDKLFE